MVVSRGLGPLQRTQHKTESHYVITFPFNNLIYFKIKAGVGVWCGMELKKQRDEEDGNMGRGGLRACPCFNMFCGHKRSIRNHNLTTSTEHQFIRLPFWLPFLPQLP